MYRNKAVACVRDRIAPHFCEEEVEDCCLWEAADGNVCTPCVNNNTMLLAVLSRLEGTGLLRHFRQKCFHS